MEADCPHGVLETTLLGGPRRGAPLSDEPCESPKRISSLTSRVPRMGRWRYDHQRQALSSGARGCLPCRCTRWDRQCLVGSSRSDLPVRVCEHSNRYRSRLVPFLDQVPRTILHSPCPCDFLPS